MVKKILKNGLKLYLLLLVLGGIQWFGLRPNGYAVTDSALAPVAKVGVVFFVLFYIAPVWLNAIVGIRIERVPATSTEDTDNETR